ncbi:MAG: hypothetical protein FWD62_15765, partial [Betaproteobacteria bacterium]|nr:hypothetical protein [Betaproteobacteria bacterium]
PATQLSDNYFRTYDQASWRYLEPDPLGAWADGPGPNPYAYAGGNPVRFIDPLGLAGMYVYFEGYMVDTGIQGIHVPLGHAGVVAIDDATGKARYFDFGRYGGEYGDIRDFTVNTVVSFDSDGMITQASAEALEAELSARFGKNNPAATIYNSKANAQKIIAFALYRKAHISEYPYTINPFGSNRFNTCINFAWAAFQAGLE